MKSYLIAISASIATPCLLMGTDVPSVSLPAPVELSLPAVPHTPLIVTPKKSAVNNSKTPQLDQANTSGLTVLGKRLPDAVDAFGLSASEECSRFTSAKQAGTTIEYTPPAVQNVPTKLEGLTSFLKVQGYSDNTEVIINGRLLSLNEWMEIAVPDTDIVRAKITSINAMGILLASDDGQTALLPIPPRSDIGNMDKEPPFAPSSGDNGKIKNLRKIPLPIKQGSPSNPNNK